MVSLIELWEPILASAGAVFVGTTIIHMLLPVHKKDYGKLGDKEDVVLAAVRSWGLRGGMYMFPMYDPKGKKDPERQRKEKEGPWGVLTVRDKDYNFGAMMGLWLLNILIISTLVGYLASVTLAAGAACPSVFRIVATAAILAYGGSALTDSIWKGRPWRCLPGAIFDAVVNAAITGGMFVWLWPKVV